MSYCHELVTLVGHHLANLQGSTLTPYMTNTICQGLEIPYGSCNSSSAIGWFIYDKISMIDPNVIQ